MTRTLLLVLSSLALGPLSCRPSARSVASVASGRPQASDAQLETAAAPMVAPSASIAIPAATSAPPPGPAPNPEAGAPATSCREVLHVGDSTSIGLVSSEYLPDLDDQIGARYRAVGVQRFLPEIAGARSLVETYKGQPNATQVVRQALASGYAGCVVLAVGTNDAANTGGNANALRKRIDAMMALIGPDRPVLWMTVKTLRDGGPYQNANMHAWTQALTSACARHPTMRIYDWASEVHDDWFIHDGIHYGSAGFRERAARIARALARAFPKDGSPPAGCLVGGR